MKYKKIFILGLIVVLVVGGGYLALRKTIIRTTSISSTTTNSVTATLDKPAPDFSVQTIDGKQFSLADHKGKPVIVFAMFGGCGECIPVGQALNQIQKDYSAKGVTILAVDILNGEPISTLQQYRDYIKAEFPLVSYNETIVNAYKLNAPEITYIINKDGNIAYINQNGLSYEQYKQQIEKIL